MQYSLGKSFSKQDIFVFIIDEWDCVFRDDKLNGEGQREYLNLLRDMLKNQPYNALAYMTGILPVKKYGEHSALNMFDEYSMTNQEVQKEFISMCYSNSLLFSKERL